MSGHIDQATARADDKIDLMLHLWEGLTRELISRKIVDDAALARIMDGASKSVPRLSSSEELGAVFRQVRERLEQSFPTAVQRADRDKVPATED